MGPTRGPEVGLFALAIVTFGLPLSLWSGGDLGSQFNDDAFYYFQIARNLAHGRGATFDGLHATSGFHPLWLLMITPIFGAISDLDAAVRAVGLLEASLLGAAAVFVYRGLSQPAGRASALLGALVLLGLPGTRRMLRTGQESALLVLLAVLLWSAWIHDHGSGLRRARTLGGICALAALARLEWLLAVPVVVLAERMHGRTRPGRLLWLTLPAFAGVGAALLWNRLATGAWLPVSGAVKHLWNGPARVRVPARWAGDLLTEALLLAPVLLLMPQPGGRLDIRVRTLRAFGLHVLLPCVSLALLFDKVWLGVLADWYLAPLVPCVAVLAAVATRRAPRLATWGAVGLVGLALVRVPVAWARVHGRETEAHRRAAGASWLRAHLPEDTRVGAWNGGMLGYYSGQSVVMLDGLANSPRFMDRVLVRGDWSGYLRDEHIDVLALTGCRLSPLIPAAERARLQQDFEPFTVVTPKGADASASCPGFAIWKRKSP